MNPWRVQEQFRQKCDFTGSLFQINQNNIKPLVLNEAIAPDGEIPQNLDLLVLRRCWRPKYLLFQARYPRVHDALGPITVVLVALVFTRYPMYTHRPADYDAPSNSVQRALNTRIGYGQPTRLPSHAFETGGFCWPDGRFGP